MISHLNYQVDTNSRVLSSRLKVTYNRAQTGEDSFPDPSLLDPIDSEHHGNINAAVKDMKTSANKRGKSKAHHKELKKQ